MIARRWNAAILSTLLPLALISRWPLVGFATSSRPSPEDELSPYRKRVEDMFYHAYDNYLRHAFPFDELRPLTCDGVNTWGNFQLTLIDALDTLVVMGNHSEFRRVAEMVIDNLHDFDIDVNTSVFEANIRVVGGLISAHLFSKRAGMQVGPKWPCDGPLLRLATDLGRRLLPAFDTATGMPYGTVNLKHGVPDGETSITCTACVGTFVLEFGTLSRLTGDPAFEKAALLALDSLWKSRSAIGLVGNHIDVEKNTWQALDAGIGAGVDSYFEYLVKGALMFEMPELMKMFREYAVSIEKYLAHGDWHFWAHMHKGGVTQPVFQSLEAFWPGMLSLVGETEGAASIMRNYYAIWKQFGFTPEFYDVARGQPMSKREGYPLRPELIESTMYLYQSTSDPFFLSIGKSILTSIEESSRVPCGFATIKNVNDHALDNRMESFFLAETTKYLYLLFTPDHWMFDGWNPENVESIRSPVNRHNASDCFLGAAGFIFNTEAHPIDVSAVHCCSEEKVEEDLQIKRTLQRISLTSLLKDNDDGDGDGDDKEEEEILNDIFDDLMGWREEEEEEEEEEEDESVERGIRENIGDALAEAEKVDVEEEEEEGRLIEKIVDDAFVDASTGDGVTPTASDGRDTTPAQYEDLEAPSGRGDGISDDILSSSDAVPSSGTDNESSSSSTTTSTSTTTTTTTSTTTTTTTSSSSSSSSSTSSSSPASPPSSSSSSSSSSPSASSDPPSSASPSSSSSSSDVEAKIRDIMEKRENNNDNKNRIVEAEGPATGDLGEAPKPTPKATNPSAEAASKAEADTWRQLASNILTRLKVDAGLKMADKLKALFEEPKRPNPNLRSNVDSWASMTCPRRAWPAQIGVYAFH